MTDQPNIFTRSHKKNGNNGKEKEQSTETPIISEDKAISQSAFLPEFSTEQAQSLSTFINETIQTANASLRAEMTAQFALLPATIANLMNTTNIQTTQPIGSNCLNSAPAQEPTSDGASYQSGFPARNFPAPPGRWRPEELGIFDSDTDDVYTFVERIREMTDIKRDSHMIQLNLSLQLRKKAKRWFELELSHENKTIDALIGRFQPSDTLTLQKLHETTYIKADAAAKKDPTDFVHDIIALTRTRPLEESLIKAYLRFESGLQINLIPPDKFTTVREFMEQINAKKHAWYQNYAHFRKKLYDDQIFGLTTSTHGTHNTSNRGYISRQPRGNSAPNYAIRSGLGPTPETSRPDAPKYNTTAPRVPQLQGIYHGTTEEHSQSRPQYTPSQSHTPRAFGNTHDDDDGAEKAYFVEHEHGCNMIDCPHRHDN
ncbi:hypothetical protein IMSHALPRED_006092 [Imshaugia aleurites]|uniref:Retrotransposon gag domain-containing protein n=1 Tax=Imshaugia aleurites TaxID=172621 RepID=A0A8H3IDJ4_9LECA|nr:hypothetical protein IMSHALPRED_006092 [Imshaugia aleurites]